MGILEIIPSQLLDVIFSSNSFIQHCLSLLSETFPWPLAYFCLGVVSFKAFCNVLADLNPRSFLFSWCTEGSVMNGHCTIRWNLWFASPLPYCVKVPRSRPKTMYRAYLNSGLRDMSQYTGSNHISREYMKWCWIVIPVCVGDWLQLLLVSGP